MDIKTKKMLKSWNFWKPILFLPVICFMIILPNIVGYILFGEIGMILGSVFWLICVIAGQLYFLGFMFYEKGKTQ